MVCRLFVIAIVLGACGGGGGNNNTTPHNVTVTVQGPGTVTSTPNGIDCPSACSSDFTDHVTLYAQPDNGATFVGWSGACSGTDPSCSISVSSDETATAMFAPAGMQTLTVSVTGPGSVSGMNLACPGSNCMQSYAPGTMVSLTATPDANASFTSWSGDCTGSGACTVTMDQARNVSATFAGPPQMHMLSVTVTGPGTVTSSPSGINCSSGTCTALFNDTDTVTLTHTPTGAGTFSMWNGYCTGNGTCSVPMTADRTVTATFASSGYVMTVHLGGDGTGTVVSNPAGINCSSTNMAGCSYDFGPSAGQITLTATPDTTSSFAGMGTGQQPGGCMGDNYASSCAYGLNSSGVTVNVWFSAWKGRYAFPATVTGLVLSGTSFVAVGTGGNSITSSNDAAGGNGAYWTGHDAPAGLNALTYQGGLYLAARDGGKVSASPDGATWTDYAAGTMDLEGIASSGSMAVAVGKAGSVQYSVNGINWVGSTAVTAYDLLDVTYGGGMFVAVGFGGSIVTSPDGITWTARTSGVTSVLYGVTFGLSRFVVVGTGGVVLTSTDGMTWTKPTTTGLPVAAIRGIAASSTTYVAAGDPIDSPSSTQAVYTSTDAITWTQHGSATFNEPTLRVAYPGDGRFYMLGSSGSIARSSNGTAWSPILAPGGRGLPGNGQSNMLSAITYNGAIWVAGGQFGSIFTSPDGVTWTSRRAGACCGTIAGIAWGAGLTTPVFAALGYTTNASYILTSPDGITWTQKYPTSGSLLGYPINVAYGGPTIGFAAVGGNAGNGTTYAITSLDGVTWTPSATASTEVTGGLADMTYGGGLFVLGGYSGSPTPVGTIWTSPNGASWTQQSVVGSSAFGPITYGNSTYVALARNSMASYTSANAINWTSNAETFTAGAAQAFGNGVFYNSALFTSTDGVTWAQISPLPNLAEINGGVFTAAVYGANQWVGVSMNELFVTHP